MTDDVLTRRIDYRAVFRLVPDCAILMTPDFVILDASAETLEVTGRELHELVDRSFFDAFPANPGDRESAGRREVCAALTEATRSHDRVMLRLHEYDVEDRGRPGVFEQRFWSGVITPLLGDDGEVAMLALWGREITPVINQLWTQRAGLV
jgi:PAS domain-containing protein